MIRYLLVPHKSLCTSINTYVRPFVLSVLYKHLSLIRVNLLQLMQLNSTYNLTSICIVLDLTCHPTDTRTSITDKFTRQLLPDLWYDILHFCELHKVERPLTLKFNYYQYFDICSLRIDKNFGSKACHCNFELVRTDKFSGLQTCGTRQKKIIIVKQNV